MIGHTWSDRDNRLIVNFINPGTFINKVPGLQSMWPAQSSATAVQQTETRRMPAAFPDTRPAAPAHTEHTTATTTASTEEERVFMSPPPAGGGGGAAPDWAIRALVLALTLFLIVASVVWFANWFNGVTGGTRTVTVIDNTTPEVRIVRPGGVVVVTTPTTTRSSNRVPTPEEVLDRQRAAGNVTRTRVPCADGWQLLPNGNCGRWVAD